MKKRTISVALAALTAFSLGVPAITAQAVVEDYPIPRSTYRYATEYVYGDTFFWYPNLEAFYEFNKDIEPIYTRKPTTAYSADKYNYFDVTTGSYVDSEEYYRAETYRVSRYSSSSNSGYTAYRAEDGFYYPTYELAREHSTAGYQIDKTLRSGTGAFFSIYNGTYYNNYASALTASRGNNLYVMILTNGNYYDFLNTPLYQNSVTNKYYLTEAEAKNADRSGTIKYSSTPTQGYYFNRATGRFYVLEAEAIAATKNAEDVIAATSYAYGYGVAVPTVPTTPSTGTSVSSGDAYLSANSAYKGWTSLANYINGRQNGSDVVINMNKQTTVPKSFFENIQYKDADVTFVNSNGSRITINGADITDPQALNFSVTYSVKTVPASAISKYSKGGIASSQMKIGDDVDFGLYSTVSVAFNSSRAGKTVRLYYYNPSTGKLSLSDSSVISSNGRATFSIRKGGTYCAIILK